MQVLTIFGPPGTGKTRTLVDHVEREGEGLFLSYTRAAAAEAVSRVRAERVKPMTLHSLAFNSQNMNRSGVVDADKLRGFSKDTGIPFKGGEKGVDEEQEGDQYVQVYSYARNAMVNEDLAYDHFGCPGTRPRWRAFVDQYESWKKTFGYMDFDDMLTLYSRNGRPTAKVVYLDESQDCTLLQWAAFERAVEKAERVYLAGDDDQAIYEWNGADPHGMTKFTERHGGETVVLEQSFRLPIRAYNMAQGLIHTIDKRQAKEFWPVKGKQGTLTQWRDLDSVLHKLGTLAPQGALILMRDRFKLNEVKRALNREFVPYDVYGGFSPWTGKLAKALRAHEKVDIPPAWVDFYKHADLSLPVKYALSTIHSAKGREHETVIMDLDMPTRVELNLTRDRDSEVRVQYVGLTRTKENLILCGQNPLL